MPLLNLAQAFGVLIGLIAIYYINPTTAGGALLLLIIAIAITNVVFQVWKYFAR